MLTRPSLPTIALACAFAAVAYGSIRYLPVLRTHRLARDLCAELGRRAAASRGEAANRAWFDRRAQEEGLRWLTSRDLHWRRIDPEHIDVGLRFETEVPHFGLFTQRVPFVWYCHASVNGCVPFEPDFEALD